MHRQMAAVHRWSLRADITCVSSSLRLSVARVSHHILRLQIMDANIIIMMTDDQTNLSHRLEKKPKTYNILSWIRSATYIRILMITSE